MKLREIIADAFGVICIFAAGYGLWIIGYALGM